MINFNMSLLTERASPNIDDKTHITQGNQVISSARRLDHGRGGSRSRNDGVGDSDPRRLGHSRAGLCLTVTA